jgi:hypothetical protein
VRLTIARCWFDADKCERGVEMLKLYGSGQHRNPA